MRDDVVVLPPSRGHDLKLDSIVKLIRTELLPPSRGHDLKQAHYNRAR